MKILSYFATIFNLEYTGSMRFLGIDYGTKRVGVALSDEAGQFAMPLSVIQNTKSLAHLVAAVKEIAVKNGVKEAVLGESKNYKGEANAILEKSLEFKRELEAQGFTVYLEPEFMTSTHAEKFQGKNDLLDASAAALILQSFLDKEKNATIIL